MSMEAGRRKGRRSLSFGPHSCNNIEVAPKTTMGTKMKGICKGFNKYITQMFVVKEQEMEIGFPTDVKHVAHIGWDGQSDDTAPSWMNNFRTSKGFSATTVSNLGISGDTVWNSEEIKQNMGIPQSSDLSKDPAPPDLMKGQKKHKRKKIRSATSSPKSSSTSKSSRAAKSRQTFAKPVGQMDSAPGL